MQKYIFIVGKADPFNAAAHAIRRADYKVGIFQDMNVTLRDDTDVDTVIEIDFSKPNIQLDTGTRNVPIAGLLTSYENYIEPKAKLGASLGLPALDLEAARRSTDKLLMRKAFNSYNPELSPAYEAVTTPEDAVSFAREFGYPVIIKPANLMKSLLITRCDTESELIHTVRHSLAEISKLYEQYNVYGRKPQLMVEQFMEGDLYSIAAFVDKDGEVHLCPGVTSLTSARQVGHDDDFLYQRVLPAHVGMQLQERLFSAARDGCLALRLQSSAAHIELIHTRNDEIKIIEIGARVGGYRPRMYALSYDIDLLEAEIATAAGNKLPDMPTASHGYSAVYELFPQKSGLFDCLVPDSVVNNLADVAHSISIKVNPGERCGPAKDGYKAVAVIIIHDEDYAAFTKKSAAVEKIKVKSL